MSSFSRIIPQAVCCFYRPQHHDDPRHQSPLRPIPPKVPRKPAPYAMINVPHGPEMTEEIHAFRRTFTQSPVCPHGSTPAQQEKPKPKRLEPKGSLDMDYNFSSGSPVPPPKKSASMRRLGNHIKQKISESRLSKSSVEVGNCDFKEEKDEKQRLDPISDADAIRLGVSAQSTGLSDFLRSRSGSVAAYDSDAKSIRTPILLSAASTIMLSPKQARNAMDEQELGPDDSISTCHPSPKPIEGVGNKSIERRARSSPFPTTPQKLTFSEAMELKPGESASVALKRISAGIAAGTIKAPTENEVRDLRRPDSQDTDGTFRTSPRIFKRSFSLQKDQNTAQTVVKRLSERVIQQKRASVQTNGTGGQDVYLLDELDPALLEYLSRFSPKHPSDSVGHTASPQTEVQDADGSRPTQEERHDVEDLSESTTPPEQSRADVVSMTPNEPPDSRSVHLFNMQISQRLASKSTATMLSSPTSGNVSRKSLEVPPPMPGGAGITSITTQYPTRIRAEHNRRPSDPHTRKLFERTPQMLPPSRNQNTSLEEQGRRPRSRDEASSVYTSEAGPSCAGNLSALDGITMSTRNPNSLAVGGRSASTEYSLRHSSRQNHSISGTQDLPLRSLSTFMAGRPGQLETASNVINKYIDGSCEDRDTELQMSTPPASSSEVVKGKTRRDSAISAKTVSTTSTRSKVSRIPGRRVSAGWLTSGQRTGWNYNFLDETTTPRARQHSAISTAAPDTITPSRRKLSAIGTSGRGLNPSPLAESATDMWNRAYRDARKDNAEKKLLSLPTVEMDDLRRSSSTNTIRLRHRSALSMHTPQTGDCRSLSAGPRTGQPPHESETYGSGKLVSTLKRLSFRHLRTRRQQITQGPGRRKPQKRSSSEVTKKVSKTSIASACQHDKFRSYRAGNTPPLKELLGIWGTFPSHDQAERNGPAGETDHVYARDFGLQEGVCEVGGELHTPLKPQSSTGALSTMHSTLRMLSMRSKRMNRKKTRSMSFPVTPGNRGQKHAKALFLNRWKRLYRTKSSEWRGYMIAGGHRSSISAGQRLEYPELETLPGEGMFSSARRRTDKSHEKDGSSATSTSTPDVGSGRNSSLQGQRNDTPTRPRVFRDCVNDRGEPKDGRNLWELATYPSIRGHKAIRSCTIDEARMSKRAQQQNMGCSGDGVNNTTQTHDSDSFGGPSAVTRNSGDIKLPGGFEDDA